MEFAEGVSRVVRPVPAPERRGVGGQQGIPSLGTVPGSLAGITALQRTAGNAAVNSLLVTGSKRRPAPLILQRDPARNDDDDTPRDRSRRARPRNAPPGTVPIDQSGLDRETIHKIKDAIGAAPDTWVGVTPDGHIVTGDSEGNVEDHGHISDYARSGSESVPKWVWGLLAFAAMIALIVLFATGVGEVGLILAGAGAAVLLVVRGALRAAGRDPGPVATADQRGDGGELADNSPSGTAVDETTALS